MADKPIAFDAYETLAEAYAAAVDTKPHNAYYERPATLSLMPEVKGKRVLDAGCGPGVYSEWLIERGAKIVAIDASPKMVELAKLRLGSTMDVRQADLSKPLNFLDSSSFDVVLCPLVLEYIEDWHSVFAEFYRDLRPQGHIIFSVLIRFLITITSNRATILQQSWLAESGEDLSRFVFLCRVFAARLVQHSTR